MMFDLWPVYSGERFSAQGPLVFHNVLKLQFSLLYRTTAKCSTLYTIDSGKSYNLLTQVLYTLGIYYTPGIYAKRYILFAFLLVHSFACSFLTVRHIRRIYLQVFG